MMRFINSLFCCLLVAGAAIDQAESTAGGTSELTGVVLRPPAPTSLRPAVTRYQGRHTSTNLNKGDDCRCNPGIYSVVYLTGDSLPDITPPDTVPEMAQENQRFQPSVLAVAVGTRVGFPNLDPFYHNVFSYSSTKRFDLGRYPQGESRTVIFDKPGIVKVFCEIHFSMRAYVHVLQTPYFATSDEQGRFHIDNVRPGRYTLHVWQENLPLLEREITVSKDSLHVIIK